MGGRLVSAAYEQWSDLGHAPFRLLAFMASMARDDDDPPCYYGGAGRLAYALGHPMPTAGEPLPRAASSAVERHMRVLTMAGAVARLRAPGPDHPTRYRLHLTASWEGQRPPLDEGRHGVTNTERPPVSEGRSTDVGAERPPLSVSTPPAERGAQHQEHQGTPPTPAHSHPGSVTGAALAAVVVEALGDLGRTVTVHTLATALDSAAADGWTPDTIRRAATSRGWSGAGGGAVVAWARGLGRPPGLAPTTAPEQLCDVHGTRHHGTCPGCRADRLADTRPLAERLAARTHA